MKDKKEPDTDLLNNKSNLNSSLMNLYNIHLEPLLNLNNTLPKYHQVLITDPNIIPLLTDLNLILLTNMGKQEKNRD